MAQQTTQAWHSLTWLAQMFSSTDTFMFNDILVLDSVRGWRERQANLFGKNPIPLIVPPERAMPIDYAVQMRCAEALFPPYDERRETFEWDLENDS